MRHYLVGKERFTSVTTYLNIIDKPFLMYWYGKHGTAKCSQLKREAGNIGTLMHDYIMADLNGHPVKASPKIKAMTKHYRKLKKQWKLKPINVEAVLISKKYKYAGRTDVIGYVKGSIACVDWKTSSMMSDEVDLQLAAYNKADTEMHWGKHRIERGYVVRFDKVDPNGKPEIRMRTRKQMNRDFKTFRAVQRVYNWKHREGVKR